MMDEIHRALKPSGTVWINLGDTYGGGVSGQGGNTSKHTEENPNIKGTKFKSGIKKPLSKCLLLIPHRFAIGCIDRGWIVRNDIIWAKRNGMPESITDRFSKKHEYIFFMVKQNDYYFNLDEIRDKHKSLEDLKRRINNGKSEWKTSLAQDIYAVSGKGRSREELYNDKGKNPGTVSDFWDIPTKPNKEQHYAQYSEDLIKKPILAGCPEDGIIYDPFMGSGSTAEAALRAKRNFIGSEMSSEYFKIANKRLEPLLNQIKMF
jgi:DNA modification methylase